MVRYRTQSRSWFSDREAYGDAWKASYKDDVKALGGVCSECGVGNSRANPLQRHHIISRHKIKSDDLRYLKLLCHECHQKEHKHKF